MFMLKTSRTHSSSDVSDETKTKRQSCASASTAARSKEVLAERKPWMKSFSRLLRGCLTTSPQKSKGLQKQKRRTQQRKTKASPKPKKDDDAAIKLVRAGSYDENGFVTIIAATRARKLAEAEARKTDGADPRDTSHLADDETGKHPIHRAVANTVKPRMSRLATENSNMSLHRRQQADRPFEFNGHSLRQITNGAADPTITEEPGNEDIGSMPTTIHVVRRTISAISCDFESDDLQDEDDVIHYTYQPEVEHHWTEVENGRQVSPSPISVMETMGVPADAPAPGWMLEWAAAGKTEAASSTKQDISSNDSVSLPTVSVDVEYLPSNPVPITAASAASGNEIFLEGWVAISTEPNWIYNDEAKVATASLYYLQVVSQSSCDNQHEVLLQLSRNDEVKKIRFKSPSMCRVSVQLVSARMGNCVVVQDSEFQLYILPVHIPQNLRGRVVNGEIDDKRTCQSLFQPFRENYTPLEGQRCYAPPDQQDSVVHLRFMLDAALRA